MKNKKELLSYLLSPSEYFTDIVTLPNVLIARWCSYGYLFQKEFNLDSKEDLNKLSVWWLKNQDTLPYLKEETR
ncbi:hypothetical protein, partial [Aliarcobacter butzleri]|uniref:hypothetical protein n=1 Tax=Aliarcobacter butzleri TaxID=28197 RepID=UPI001260CCAD